METDAFRRTITVDEVEKLNNRLQKDLLRFKAN